MVASTTLFAKANDFTDSLLSAVTVDEGGNFVNVIYSPLTLWDIDAGGNVLAAPRADYHIKAGSIAVNNARNSGTNSSIGANYVPAADFDAQTRVNPVDIGADELSVPPADLAITQNSDGRTIVARGTNGVTYTIVVTNNGPSAVTNATLTDNLPGGLRASSHGLELHGVRWLELHRPRQHRRYAQRHGATAQWWYGDLYAGGQRDRPCTARELNQQRDDCR